MLKVLIVGLNASSSTVVLLKDRLEVTIPGNEYQVGALDNVAATHGAFDVILTFEELKPHIEAALKGHDTPYKIKTIEGFNEFAKNAFNEYLQG